MAVLGERYGSKFGKISGGLTVRGGRERLLFIGAASVTLVLVIAFVIIANISQKTPARTVVENADPFASVAVNSGNAVKLYGPDKTVPAGTKLSDISFKELQWPRHQVPDDAIRSPAEFAALYARVDLPPGMPVTKSQTTKQIVAKDTASLRLTPGNRAVSIEVDETSGLEGHALPGTHVDVVLTNSQGGELQSSIIVQNARVLSYGGDTTVNNTPGARPLRLSKTITLDVATADALKISTARQMGRISLIMRAPDDVAAATIDKIDDKDLNRTQPGSKKSVSRSVNKTGKVKMGDKMFFMNSDGSLTPIDD